VKRTVTAAAAAAAIAGALALVAATPAAHADGNKRFVSAEDILAMPLEDQPPRVDLYTFGNGAVIFEKFGHAALCLSYHTRGRPPMCFNYGVTNFRELGKLVWGFLRTEQKFWVEPEPLANMYAFYARFEDRTIYRQVLFDNDQYLNGVQFVLSPDQAREIEKRLLHDIREENKFYYYDHFFDNCTTRLRGMLNDVTGGKLRDGETKRYYPITFREIGVNGLESLGQFLGFTDFFGGRTLDRYPTMWEAQFLPDVLRQEVEAKLGVTPEVIYQRRGTPIPTHGTKGRLFTTLLAFAFALPLLLARWRRRFEKPALIWAMVPLVVWGLVTWSLSIISSIPMFRWNEAVFVFVPFDVILPFLGERRRRIYARVRLSMVLLASVLCAVGLFKQPLWVPLLTAFLPFAILSFDLPWVKAQPREEVDESERTLEPATESKSKAKAKARAKAKRSGVKARAA
jgi:hypothetical protein